MLFLQKFPTWQVSVSILLLSSSVSKTKAFQWCWVSWKPASPPLQVGWAGSVSEGFQAHMSCLWTTYMLLLIRTALLWIESAKSVADGSSEPCLLEKAPSLCLERWFRHWEWPCLCFLSPGSRKGVPIGLILCMLDGLMYCTPEVWSHSSAWRSMCSVGRVTQSTLMTCQARGCLLQV